MLSGLDLEIYLDRRRLKKVVNFLWKKCTPRQNPDYAYMITLDQAFVFNIKKFRIRLESNSQSGLHWDVSLIVLYSVPTAQVVNWPNYMIVIHMDQTLN